MIKRTIHLLQLLSYKILSLLKLNHTIFNFHCDHNSNPRLKIYVYDLPYYYSKNDHFDLRVTYQTFEAINSYFKKCVRTFDPTQADYFFVPINLHRFQYHNHNPKDLLNHLHYLTNKKDHIIVATGDFAQRGKHYGHGQAYKMHFEWLKDFILLALESTPDLIPNQDIGLIPYNTLSKNPSYNHNHRKYLYSFLGNSYQDYLPVSHVRRRLFSLTTYPDTLISESLSNELSHELSKNYRTNNEYELLSRNSIFTLVPAGYGRWTYRFFQSIQWGSIPVLLSDNYLLPFNDQVPYEKFSIRIAESDISRLNSIIRGISDKKIKSMQAELKKAQQLFTPDHFFAMLFKQLVKQRKYI